MSEENIKQQIFNVNKAMARDWRIKWRPVCVYAIWMQLVTWAN